MTENTWDAIVIGAGAGGMFAAARLSHAGYKVLVVERLDKVGGRASTDELDGFKINNGAIVIELGGITEETFDEVGAKFDIRRPEPPILYRIGKKDVDVTGGGWGLMLSKLTRSGAKLVKGLGAARNDTGLPENEISTADWVRKFSKKESVHGIFRNMCGSVFAVGSEELPARVFLTYFTRKSAFKKFGFCPAGTIGVWQSLAEVVQSNGSDVWLNSEVKSLTFDGDRVTGAVIERNGETITTSAKFVVSDVGPYATLGLIGRDRLPSRYVRQIEQLNRPCGMISVNFASQRKLISAPGLLSFATSRRLCYVANFSELCPEMSPEGWYLYQGTAVPKPSVGDFDEKSETELLLQDLREQVAGFDQAKILSINVTRDEWPPQRAVAGFDMPYRTPIANLWNVGDAVKEYANGGTTACAETAKIVVDEIRQQYSVVR